MTMKLSFKTKIRINGREYGSADEMPPDIRATYERAMASVGQAGAETGSAGGTPKIIFNGQEYHSVEEMPAHVREIYQRVMATVEVERNGTPDASPSVTPAPAPAFSNSSAATSSPSPAIVPGIVRPESAMPRLALVAIGVLLLALLGFWRTLVSP